MDLSFCRSSKEVNWKFLKTVSVTILEVENVPKNTELVEVCAFCFFSFARLATINSSLTCWCDVISKMAPGTVKGLLTECLVAWLISAVENYFCLSSSDRKSTRLNSSHANISYAVFCLKKKKINMLAYTYATHQHSNMLIKLSYLIYVA